MTEIIIPIPARIKNAVPGGHVAGAEDIIDDTLNMTQDVINQIVSDKVITVSMSSSSSATSMGTQGSVKITASAGISMDTITIKKDGTAFPNPGSGTSYNVTDNAVSDYGTTAYTSEFVKGGLTKTSSITVGAVYYGASTNTSLSAFPSGSKFIFKTSSAGTYNVTVGTAASYVWFFVPSSMSISRATKSGFDFPLENPVTITVEGVSYKAYRSSNTYDAGTESVTLYA